ncbi:hypothetical protein ABK040_001260 [Willaertia magna]
MLKTKSNSLIPTLVMKIFPMAVIMLLVWMFLMLDSITFRFSSNLVKKQSSQSSPITLLPTSSEIQHITTPQEILKDSFLIYLSHIGGYEDLLDTYQRDKTTTNIINIGNKKKRVATNWKNKESFARQFRDFLIMTSRTSTCSKVFGDTPFVRCGLTNQLSELTTCFILLNSFNQRFKKLSHNLDETTFNFPIKAIVEPSVCASGGWDLCSCDNPKPMSYIWNFDNIKKTLLDKEVWKYLFPVAENRLNKIDDKILKPKLSQIIGNSGQELYYKKINEKRKENVGSTSPDGILLLKQTEYLQMQCIRENIDIAIENWSKRNSVQNNVNVNNKESIFNRINSNNENSENNSPLDLLLDELYSGKKISQPIERWIKILLDSTAKCNKENDYFKVNWTPTSLNPHLNPPLLDKFNYDNHVIEDAVEEFTAEYVKQANAIEEKDVIEQRIWFKKTINIGFVYGWLQPLQNYEVDLYSKLFTSFIPRADWLHKMDPYYDFLLNKYPLKVSGTTNQKLVVVHLQMVLEDDNHIYPSCQRLPLNSEKVYNWIGLLKHQMQLPKRTTVLLIGFGFNDETRKLLPIHQLQKLHGITLVTQTDLFGPSDSKEVYYNSVAAFHLATYKSDIFVEAVCGSQFASHIVFLRLLNGKPVCTASHVKRTSDYPHLKFVSEEKGYDLKGYDEKTEFSFQYPNIYSDNGLYFRVPRCEQLTTTTRTK